MSTTKKNQVNILLIKNTDKKSMSLDSLAQIKKQEMEKIKVAENKLKQAKTELKKIKAEAKKTIKIANEAAKKKARVTVEMHFAEFNPLEDKDGGDRVYGRVHASQV